jgi:putative ABC transport system substrate-binding protein
MFRGNDELEGAFPTMVRDRADVVILSGSLSLRAQADLALKHRLPTLHNQSSFARGGVLVSYGASSAERAREIARYVDRIFKGAKPADLPVQQPSMFELVINLKTAKAIGLTISPTLLARADEVIE